MTIRPTLSDALSGVLALIVFPVSAYCILAWMAGY